MKLKIFLFILSLVSVFSFLDSLGDSPVAYLLPKGQLEGNLRLHQISSTLDILDLRELDPGRVDSYGDMNGYGGGIRFGISKNKTIFLDQDLKIFDYSRSKLHVHSEKIAIRFPLTLKSRFDENYAWQVSYRKNRGSGISKLFSSVTFQNSVFAFNPPAEFHFSGVEDSEIGIMGIVSKEFNSRFLGSLFFEWAQGRVSGGLGTSLPVFELQKILSVLDYDQSKLDMGYSMHWKLNRSHMLELDYHYLLLDRSVDVSDPVRTNEIVNVLWRFSRNPDSQFWIQGKYLKNQFIGETSFLYNKEVASRSDRKYGYLTLGYTFRYGYGK